MRERHVPLNLPHHAQNVQPLQSAVGANVTLMAPQAQITAFVGTKYHGTAVPYDLMQHFFLK